MTTLATIADKIEGILKEKLFHPRLRGRALDEVIAEFGAKCRRDGISDIVPHVNNALKSLGVSNTSFWENPGRALAPQWALNATVKLFLEGTQEVWLFKDVLAGGVADTAGILPGETLLAIDGLPLTSEPKFELGRTYKLTVLDRLGKTRREVPLSLPSITPKSRPPMVEPDALASSVLKPGIGLLRVAAFPGIIGFDFARELTKIIEGLEQEKCNRLIVDLRANCGGGLGSLRLMSLLTPGKVEVGHSLSRTARESGTKASTLPVIDRIPDTKLGLYAMALKLKFSHRDRSFRLATEGIGVRPFQGKIAILADESSRSGSEMVAAFAQSNQLATIVGSKTPGETLGAANFRIEDSYRLRIPLVGWFQPNGEVLEGKGITPDYPKSPTLDGLRSGKDEILEEAVALLV
jgi:carboxyl-terminal processing protease